jgi:hypothetical protein
MADAEVTIDASKGTLSVRGEQAFVSEILDKYKFIFEHAPKAQHQPTPSTLAASQPAAATGGIGTTADSLDAFSNVFDVNGDSVSVLVTPPGNTVAAQTRSLTLLYLFARLKMGDSVVSSEAVKEQLKAHACFDPKNFSTLMKSQKNLISATGKGVLSLKLTVPGRKAAEELAQNLQNGG